MLSLPKSRIDVFDVLLTRNMEKAHIIDFNPYSPRTDTLLLSYEELHELRTSQDPASLPKFAVIDSRAHPAANTNAPTHQHNMMPFEAFSLGNGRDIEEFAQKWRDGILETMQ
jgi:hypothetical protein